MILELLPLWMRGPRRTNLYSKGKSSGLTAILAVHREQLLPFLIVIAARRSFSFFKGIDFSRSHDPSLGRLPTITMSSKGTWNPRQKTCKATITSLPFVSSGGRRVIWGEMGRCLLPRGEKRWMSCHTSLISIGPINGLENSPPTSNIRLGPDSHKATLLLSIKYLYSKKEEPTGSRTKIEWFSNLESGFKVRGSLQFPRLSREPVMRIFCPHCVFIFKVRSTSRFSDNWRFLRVAYVPLKVFLEVGDRADEGVVWGGWMVGRAELLGFFFRVSYLFFLRRGRELCLREELSLSTDWLAWGEGFGTPSAWLVKDLLEGDAEDELSSTGLIDFFFKVWKVLFRLIVPVLKLFFFFRSFSLGESIFKDSRGERVAENDRFFCCMYYYWLLRDPRKRRTYIFFKQFPFLRFNTTPTTTATVAVLKAYIFFFILIFIFFVLILVLIFIFFVFLLVLVFLLVIILSG